MQWVRSNLCPFHLLSNANSFSVTMSLWELLGKNCQNSTIISKPNKQKPSEGNCDSLYRFFFYQFIISILYQNIQVWVACREAAFHMGRDRPSRRYAANAPILWTSSLSLSLWLKAPSPGPHANKHFLSRFSG